MHANTHTDRWLDVVCSGRRPWPQRSGGTQPHRPHARRRGSGRVGGHGSMRRTRRTCGGQHVLHKDEDGLLRGQLDALADDVHELPHCQVRGHQVPAAQQGVQLSYIYLRDRARAVGLGWAGTSSPLRTHFFLSMSGMSLFSAFSTITCIAAEAGLSGGSYHKRPRGLPAVDREGWPSALPLLLARSLTHWDSVRVLLLNAASLCLPLICRCTKGTRRLHW